MNRKFSTPFIDLLYDCSHKQRVALLQTSNTQQLKLILELLYNLVGGNIDISKQSRTELKPHTNVLNKLTSRRISLVKKRGLLIKNYKVFLLFLKAVKKFLSHGA